MSREKQIEEMAHIVSDAIKTWVYEAPPISNPHFVAAAIYDAGYRKQSEGEWQEDIIAFCNVCSACKAKVDRYAIKCKSGNLNFCPNCGAKMKGGAE